MNDPDTNRRMPRTSPLFLKLLLAKAQEHGFEQSLVEQFDLNEERLDNEGLRIPLNQLMEVWQATAERLNDPLLGLHIGGNVHPTDYSLISYAWMNCENLYKGMRLVGHYIPLVCSAFSSDLKRHKGASEFILVSDSYPGLDLTPLIEVSITSVHYIGRFLVGPEHADKVRFEEVSFMHSPRGDIAEYERVLQAPVKFNQPQNSMLISVDTLKLPMRAPSPAILKHTLKELDQLKVDYLGSQRLADRVRCFIGQQFPDSVPTVECAAEHFHTSTSTLKRKLYKEGTSFRQLLDEIRLYEAYFLLQEGKHKLGNISEILGYANESSFFRAFRRLTGLTPKEYQQSLPRQKPAQD